MLNMEHRKVVRKKSHAYSHQGENILRLFFAYDNFPLSLMYHLKNTHETSQNPSDVKD